MLTNRFHTAGIQARYAEAREQSFGITTDEGIVGICSPGDKLGHQHNISESSFAPLVIVSLGSGALLVGSVRPQERVVARAKSGDGPL